METAGILIFWAFPPVHVAGILIFWAFPPVNVAGILIFWAFPPVHVAGILVFWAFPPVHVAGILVFWAFPSVHVAGILIFWAFPPVETAGHHHRPGNSGESTSRIVLELTPELFNSQGGTTTIRHKLRRIEALERRWPGGIFACPGDISRVLNHKRALR